MNLDKFEKFNHTSRVSECEKDRDSLQNNQFTKIYNNELKDD